MITFILMKYLDNKKEKLVLNYKNFILKLQKWILFWPTKIKKRKRKKKKEWYPSSWLQILVDEELSW